MQIVTNGDVAAKVRGVAAERGLKQAQLADAIGMSKMRLSRRFSGVTPFSPAELISIARVFDVPVGAFYGDRAHHDGFRANHTVRTQPEETP